MDVPGQPSAVDRLLEAHLVAERAPFQRRHQRDPGPFRFEDGFQDRETQVDQVDLEARDPEVGSQRDHQALR